MHIYLNSVEQVKEQVLRKPKERPILKMPKIDSIEDLIDCNIDDFILEGYDPHPPIRAEMAV